MSAFRVALGRAYELNDQLLSLKSRLGALTVDIAGPIPPRSQQATMPEPPPASIMPKKSMIDELDTINKANCELALDIRNALQYLENNFIDQTGDVGMATASKF